MIKKDPCVVKQKCLDKWSVSYFVWKQHACLFWISAMMLQRGCVVLKFLDRFFQNPSNKIVMSERSGVGLCSKLAF